MDSTSRNYPSVDLNLVRATCFVWNGGNVMNVT